MSYERQRTRIGGLLRLLSASKNAHLHFLSLSTSSVLYRSVMTEVWTKRHGKWIIKKSLYNQWRSDGADTRPRAVLVKGRHIESCQKLRCV